MSALAAGVAPDGGQNQAAPAADEAPAAGASPPPAAAADPLAAAVAEPEAAAEPLPREELERELAKAEADPADFNQWVAVEKLADKLGDIQLTRRAYDGLLAEFPLCYGYWKRYADAEQRAGSSEWALHVYERAAAATPYSPELWCYYAAHQQRLGAPADTLRALYEQGLAYVGSDSLAHGLWDRFLSFETEQGNFAAVTGLYLRILGTPLKELDRFYASLRQHVEERPAADLMSTEEQQSLAASLQEARLAQAAAAAQAEQPAGDPMDTDAAPAPAPPPGAALDAADAAGGPAGEPAAAPEPAVEAGAGRAEVTEADVKAHWLSGVAALYQASSAELAARRPFEAAIKRPYFHVKPLDAAQLAAWAGLLDHALQGGDAGTVVRLFERCLVACASYPEFWVRYVRYLEAADAGSAAPTLARAEQVFCKRSAAFLLFAARFHERHGDAAAARGAYQRALAAAPGMAEAVAQAAAFERRQGDAAAARTLWGDALAAEEAREGAQDSAAVLAVFCAHSLHLDGGDAAAARAVLQRALGAAPGLRYLWEAAIHFEEHLPGADRAERVLALYERAAAVEEGDEAGRLPAGDLEALSSSGADFAARSADAATAERLAAAHTQRWGKYVKLAASRKRRAEAEAGESAAKRPADQAADAAADASAAAPAANGMAHDASAAYAGAYAALAGHPAASGVDAAHAYYQPAASGAYAGYGYYPQQQQQQYGYAAGQYPGY